ncbi:UNVERIFIED_CONTAM: hypothetical protein NCL1_62878 [Trichonephila clavipes]
MSDTVDSPFLRPFEHARAPHRRQLADRQWPDRRPAGTGLHRRSHGQRGGDAKPVAAQSLRPADPRSRPARRRRPEPAAPPAP